MSKRTPSRSGGTARSGGSAAGRPRSEEASRTILETTLALLREKGFAELRVDEIAERAGVGKATIYRRWPSKLELAADAFAVLPELPEPSSGSLIGDLVELVSSTVELFRKGPLAGVLPAFAAERARNPALSGMLAPVIEDRRKAFFAVLRRGIERGELPSTLNLDLTVDLVIGPALTRVLVTGDVVDEHYVEKTVRIALSGIIASAQLD